MWHFVAENPWYLAGALGLVALGFLIALKVTQDGRNLMRALIALGLAAVVLVVEQLIVTDAERIEWKVKELIDALLHSDAARASALMDEHVVFTLRNTSLGDELDIAAFMDRLSNDLTFDWLHLSRLTTSAGEQSLRGSAEFKVGAAGTYRSGGIGYNFAGNSEWSLGFRKVASGEWKIVRISAEVLPPRVSLPIIPYRRGNGPNPAEPRPMRGPPRLRD